MLLHLTGLEECTSSKMGAILCAGDATALKLMTATI